MMILENFIGGPLGTRGVLLGCPQTRCAVLIDVPAQIADSVKEYVEANGFLLEKVLLTHSHWDHIAGLAELKKLYPIPVYVHRADVDNLISPGSDGILYYMAIEGVKPDGFVEEDQVVWVGNLQLKVLHTPGHSPGSVCYWIEKERTLISGDTLFKGGMGRVDFPGSESDKMKVSLSKLARLPKDAKIIPGHGSLTTIEAEKWLNAILI